jgi:hypothetical protein
LIAREATIACAEIAEIAKRANGKTSEIINIGTAKDYALFFSV